MRLAGNALRILCYLNDLDEPWDRQKDVGAAIGARGNSMGPITERLRARGLIEKTYSAEARDYCLTITERGRQSLAPEVREMAEGRA
jgi:DNA-binding MarR family transcriptional regulator